jgi:prevent-host-death family protein
MVRQLTATDVKAKLLAVLDEVAAGDEVEITRHGRTIAKIVPAKNAGGLKGRLRRVASSAATDDELFSTGAEWDLP